MQSTHFILNHRHIDLNIRCLSSSRYLAGDAAGNRRRATLDRHDHVNVRIQKPTVLPRWF
jgi:hypothetical protein